MKAMRAQIPNIPLIEFDLQDIKPQGRMRRLRYRAPQERADVTMIGEPFPQNVSELVNKLRQKGAL
jgi:hypothetical protein